MKTNNYEKAISLLKEAQTVAIFMHINPDPDCLGSALALSAFLRKLGKKVSVFTPDTKTTSMIASRMLFLPYVDTLNKGDRNGFDLSVAVDLGDTGRIGDWALPLFYKGEKSLVIDHHETFSDFAAVTIREQDAGSTAQILYKMLCEYDKDLIDKDIATLLYAGIVTDCGNFSYNCTSEESFVIASELLRYGIDFSEITRKLTKDVEYNVFRLKTKILSETRFFFDNKMAVITFRKKDFIDTATTEKDTDGIINEVQNITSVLLSVSIAEVGTDSYKISFRSKGEVNARACAETFGGGGHYNAAGCRLHGSFEEVFEKLLAVGKKNILYV